MNIILERRKKFHNALTVLNEIKTTCRFPDVIEMAQRTGDLCEEVLGSIDELEDTGFVSLNVQQFIDTMQSVVHMELNFLATRWDQHLHDEKIILH